MGYHYLALINCVLIFFLSLKIYGRDLFSPVSLNCLSWGIVFLIGIFIGHGYHEIPQDIFFSWVFWFYITNVIFFLMKPDEKLNSDLNEIKTFSYWPIVILITAFTLYRVYVVGTSGNFGFILNLRMANVDKSGEFSDIGGILFFSLPFLFLLGYEILSGKNKLNIASLSLYQVAFILATSAKFAVINAIFIAIVCVNRKKRLSMISFFKYFSLLLIAMLILHITRMASNDDRSIIDLLGIYIYSPIVAVQYLEPSKEFGEYTFRFLYAVLNKAEIIDLVPVDTILEYKYVPYGTNVFTVFQPFYQDFSYIGIVIFSIIYGLIFGLFYRKYRQGKALYIIAYSFFCVSLATQFLSETLITNFSQNVKFLLFGYIIIRIMNFGKSTNSSRNI